MYAVLIMDYVHNLSQVHKV